MEYEHDHPQAFRKRPAAPSRHAPPPRDPAHDDQAADVHALNMRAEQVRRQVVKARAAGEPEPQFGPLSEAPDLYSPSARLARFRRQVERERAVRQAAQGAPAPVSLPPPSPLARWLQEGPGAVTAATLMRQFAAERAARAAEADASPPPLPLRHRAPAADGATGPVIPAEAPTATPHRQDEEHGTHGAHGAEGVPPARLPATGPAVAAPAPRAPGRVERERDAVAHTLAEPAPHRAPHRAPHGADGGPPRPGACVREQPLRRRPRRSRRAGWPRWSSPPPPVRSRRCGRGGRAA